MSYSLKRVLMKRDGMTDEQADYEIKNIRYRVWKKYENHLEDLITVLDYYKK